MIDYTPLDIRAELVRRGITNAEIGRRAGNVSRQSVTQAIYGQTKSSRIRQAIAEAIGRSVHEIWPDNGKGKKTAEASMS
jgi:lambda repressor-like predicted transcriptional regulator